MLAITPTTTTAIAPRGMRSSRCFSRRGDAALHRGATVLKSSDGVFPPPPGGVPIAPCHRSMQASRPLRRFPSTAAPSATWRRAKGRCCCSSTAWPGRRATGRPVIEPLALNSTVVAPDFPGHGKSAPGGGDYSLGSLASGLRDLMMALGHDRATLVGHSLGGGVALQFAYQFPEMVERLVLVSSGGLGPEVGDDPPRRGAARRRSLHPRHRRPRLGRRQLADRRARQGRPASQRRSGRGRPRLRLARRRRSPQGLPLDPPRGGRHRGPAGRRPRPPLPRRGPPGPDRLGRARPDHPGRATAAPPTPSSPAAASRSSPKPATCRCWRAPAASSPSSNASSTRPSRPNSTAPSGAPASAASNKCARLDSNQWPYAPEAYALSS